MVKKIRMSLDVTPAMKKIIEDLAAPEGITQGEVFRRAIALLRAAQKAKADGEDLVTVKDGEIKCKLIGW